MEKLNIKSTEITWERIKSKNGSEIKYKNQIIKVDGYICISKTMYVDRLYMCTDIAHIPIELIDKLKDLHESV